MRCLAIPLALATQGALEHFIEAVVAGTRRYFSNLVNQLVLDNARKIAEVFSRFSYPQRSHDYYQNSWNKRQQFWIEAALFTGFPMLPQDGWMACKVLQRFALLAIHRNFLLEDSLLPGNQKQTLDFYCAASVIDHFRTLVN